MRIAYAVLSWGIIALGIVHMASSPRTLTLSALWFFAGGLLIAVTGALNLLNRAYGATAPGLRWVCVGTNAVVTAFAVVVGIVSHAGIGGLITIGGWMGVTAVLSAIVPPRPNKKGGV